jgi:hypothetical protein
MVYGWVCNLTAKQRVSGVSAAVSAPELFVCPSSASLHVDVDERTKTQKREGGKGTRDLESTGRESVQKYTHSLWWGATVWYQRYRAMEAMEV